MAICERERKRIRSFLKDAASRERVNALTMLSMERKMVQAIPGDFLVFSNWLNF